MKFSGDWCELSSSQLHVLAALSFAMPVHAGYGTRRLGIKSASVISLEKRGLVRSFCLHDDTSPLSIPFWTLTQAGERTRRDYIKWFRAIGSKLGSLPAPMVEIAELPL